MDFLPNDPGSFDSSSSPSIAQKPPIGKILTEYTVPFLSIPNSFGPIPSANSCTVTPFFFANIK